MRNVTNEGKFMESLRAFVDAAPKYLINPGDEKMVERVVRLYESPNLGPDPLVTLPPGEAKLIKEIQEMAAPDLSAHPFFQRVAEISHRRWSDQVQEIIDARNYYIQCDIGATPENRPSEEVLALVRAARKDAPSYEALAKTNLPDNRTNPIRTPAPPSRFAGILQMLKDNW